jgi:hypothetical protein
METDFLARLHELVNYDPETGEMRWKVARSPIRAGDEVGTIAPDGYRRVMIDGKRYLVHRLAWLMTTGSWPVQMLDHIDHIRSNNRIANLRESNNSKSARGSEEQQDRPARCRAFLR